MDLKWHKNITVLNIKLDQLNKSFLFLSAVLNLYLSSSQERECEIILAMLSEDVSVKFAIFIKSLLFALKKILEW